MRWVLASCMGCVMDGPDVQCSLNEWVKGKEITQLCFPNVFGEVPPQREIYGGKVRMSSKLLLAIDQKLAKRIEQ